MRRIVLNLGITLLGACAALAACLWWTLETSPAGRARDAAERDAAAHRLIASEQAYLIRERAECLAAAREYGAAHAAACWEHLRLQTGLAERTIQKATDTLGAR